MWIQRYIYMLSWYSRTVYSCSSLWYSYSCNTLPTFIYEHLCCHSLLQVHRWERHHRQGSTYWALQPPGHGRWAWKCPHDTLNLHLARFEEDGSPRSRSIHYDCIFEQTHETRTWTGFGNAVPWIAPVAIDIILSIEVYDLEQLIFYIPHVCVGLSYTALVG